MSEYKKLTYLEACKIALFYSYFDFIKDESTFGNGFEIMSYGFKLVLSYFVQLLARVAIALIFPLSALLIMPSRKKFNDEYERFEAKATDDL